jgi:uncharacterized Zn finger protein
MLLTFKIPKRDVTKLNVEGADLNISSLETRHEKRVKFALTTQTLVLFTNAYINVILENPVVSSITVAIKVRVNGEYIESIKEKIDFLPTKANCLVKLETPVKIIFDGTTELLITFQE